MVSKLVVQAVVAGVCVVLAACGSGELGEGGPSIIEKATPATPAGIANAQPVFRFAKISNGAYFYTGSVAEKDVILRDYPDFRCEGVAFYRTSDGSGTPVYRFANLRNGGYFYTASEAERDAVLQSRPDLRYEGTTFSVAGAVARGQPVYRLANLVNGAYLYTASQQEQQFAASLGTWRYEGEAFVGTPPPANLSVPAGGWCPAQPVPVSGPEGLFVGATSDGYGIQVLILENNEAYGMVTSGNILAGMVYASGSASGGNYVSNLARSYDFFSGQTLSGSLRASYTPNSAISGTFSSGSRSVGFSGAYVAPSVFNYQSPASLSSIAGSWSGFFSDGRSGVTTITSSGSFAAVTSGGCTMSGTIAPRPSGKNVFNVSVTFGPSPCLLARATVTGVALSGTSRPGVRTLAVAVTSPDRSLGAMFLAER